MLIGWHFHFHNVAITFTFFKTTKKTTKLFNILIVNAWWFVSVGLRRDDSSIDSLVDREYFPGEHDSSPKTTNSHLSPSNLSRDSGVTLSDTQLYDEDACPHHETSGKTFQRSSSQFDSQEPDVHEAGYYSRSADNRYDRRHNPVAPPRKKATKKMAVPRQGDSKRPRGQ